VLYDLKRFTRRMAREGIPRQHRAHLFYLKPSAKRRRKVAAARRRRAKQARRAARRPP